MGEQEHVTSSTVTEYERKRTLEAIELIRSRKQAYLSAFENNKILLDDLKEFCRAEESTFHPDPRIHAVIEGRREVWLRIEKYLERSVDDIYATLRQQNSER